MHLSQVRSRRGGPYLARTAKAVWLSEATADDGGDDSYAPENARLWRPRDRNGDLNQVSPSTLGWALLAETPLPAAGLARCLHDQKKRGCTRAECAGAAPTRRAHPATSSRCSCLNAPVNCAVSERYTAQSVGGRKTLSPRLIRCWPG